METAASLDHTEQKHRHAWTWRRLVGFWLASGVALLLALGNPPVQRTQEARVAEVARQMLGGGLRGWMIPMLNGQVRLQKPPLAYWMTAISYKMGGVNEWTARIPAVIAGWLTLAVTFGAASWLFGRRAGLLAAAMLAGSYLFSRHVRLAETDAPAMLFVTVAVYGLWRGCAAVGGVGDAATGSTIPSTDGPSPLPSPGVPGEGEECRSGGGAPWFHVGAAGIALAIMAKGPPGLFPVLFFVGLMVLSRRWGMAWAFIRSGAPLTLAVLALPWFLYVIDTIGLAQFREELRVVVEGDNHPAWFFNYLLWLVVATSPWCALMPLSLVEAGRRWGNDWRLRGTLVWIAAIFIPLCFAGNKQPHYLLPVMPPVMILVGWLCDQALGGARRLSPAALTEGLIRLTLLIVGVGAAGIIVAGRVQRGSIESLDIVISAAMLLVVIATIVMYWRRGPEAAILGFAGGWAVLLPLLTGLWVPSWRPDDVRAVAARIQGSFGSGPYCFVGENRSLGLCFAMRSAIGQAADEAAMRETRRREPGVVFIAQTKSDRVPPPIPAEFGLPMEIRTEEQIFEVYGPQR